MLKGEFIVNIKEAFKKKNKIFLIFEYFPKNLLNLIEIHDHGLNVPPPSLSPPSSAASPTRPFAASASSTRRTSSIGTSSPKISFCTSTPSTSSCATSALLASSPTNPRNSPSMSPLAGIAVPNCWLGSAMERKQMSGPLAALSGSSSMGSPCTLAKTRWISCI